MSRCVSVVIQKYKARTLTAKDGGNATDCWAAPVRPEPAALVCPYTSEQFLPSDPILFLLGHGTRRGLTRRRR